MPWPDELTSGRLGELVILTTGRLPEGLRVPATVDTSELEGPQIPDTRSKPWSSMP